MSDLKPTEKKFENHIEKYFNSIEYKSIHYEKYDRTLCLIKDEVLDFIKKSQKEKWDTLKDAYGEEVESKVLDRISSEISRRGVIDVLRNQVSDRGVYLDLCYFEPKSDLNPDHFSLFESNQFSLVRQLHYSTKNENSIDMGLFLNGIPIVTMELKNQLTGQNYKHSENQYRFDRDPKEPLLQFKRVLVHFCVDNNQVSMTTNLKGGKTRFFPYNKDIENPPVENDYRSSYLWKEVLNPNSLLDVIENFAHISNEKEYYYNEEKQTVDTKKFDVQIFPRYHQLELIRNLKEQIKNDGAGNNYLIQHTTGSGKSYSIGWLSHLLTSLYKSKDDKRRIFDSIIVVTDRTNLDDQLRGTVKSLSKVDGVVFGAEKGSKELREFLEKGKDIIITTIQKFPYISEDIVALGDKKFAVIIDEVHSSQNGELSKELKRTLTRNEDDEEEDFTLESYLEEQIQTRGRQKHISFFGFTGTPKEKTLEIFGTKLPDNKFKPFHVYSMRQSIHEGYTLDVLQNYSTYKRYFKVKEVKEDAIEIDTAQGTKEIFNYVDSHQITIDNKVKIILDHFFNKSSKEIQGKSRGMIVVKTRKLCVQYFKEINRQLDERKSKFKCLVGFSGEVKFKGDPERYTEKGLNLTIGHDGDVPLGLKNPKYRLLVVANKFQTGFDEPMLQSMYIDKPLKDVQCVQTLSRLNRTMSGKASTFVLDFANDPEAVRFSFQKFYQEVGLEEETDPNTLYNIQTSIDEFKIFSGEQVDMFCSIFFDKDREEGNLHPVLDEVVDNWNELDDDEQREDFRLKVASYIRLYSYLSQIINFSDVELEKKYIFYRYLSKKLRPKTKEKVNIEHLIDLESLRIQKLHDQIDPLEKIDHEYEGIKTTVGTFTPPAKDLLSEIIETINSRYGINLTDDDKVNIDTVRQKIFEDEEIEKYMNGANSEQNKQDYFKKQFDNVILSLLKDRFDFYKKLDENSGLKNLIFDKIYKDYKESKNK
ncbi:type I restriction endonuclease subunit R [Candidatus Pelagibacter sp.]|uniref:type I restriction endonuclease subunit R n=1 Tax=Candidatus Pelagibacter sp. TaxID=2024849 RepID=UPI003F847C58